MGTGPPELASAWVGPENEGSILGVMDLFTQVTSGFSEAQDIESVGLEVGRAIERFLPVEHSGLYFWDRKLGRMRLIYAHGFSEDERREAERTAWERHPGSVFRSQQTLHVPDTHRDPAMRTQSSRRSFEIRSRLYMPVVWRGQSIAVLGLASVRPNPFTPFDMRVLRFLCQLTGVVYGQIQDRDERVRAQEELTETAHQLQMVLDSLPIALTAVTEQGIVRLAQGGTLRHFDNLAQGSHVSALLEEVPEVEELLQRRSSPSPPARRIRRDGRVLEVTGQRSPVGEGTVLLFRDLTSHHEAMTRLEELNRQLADARDAALVADRAKSDFLATMSHELRTPLNGIIGYAELALEDAGMAESLAADLSRIRRSAHTLLRLINNILDLSRIEAGHMPLHYDDVDLPRLLHDVVAEVGMLIEQGQNELVLTLHPQVATVRTDPDLVRRVVVNLLGNAIKFTHAGRIELRTRPATGGFVIEVHDTGIGIDDRNLARIFQAFTQVDASRSRRYDGTGLGLTITQSLVALLGGSVTVESEHGVGSCFRIRLPDARSPS